MPLASHIFQKASYWYTHSFRKAKILHARSFLYYIEPHVKRLGFFLWIGRKFLDQETAFFKNDGSEYFSKTLLFAILAWWCHILSVDNSDTLPFAFAEALQQ